MIEEGCFKHIYEVYGYHSIPNFDEGDIRVCEDGFFAKATMIKIIVKGHGTTPHKLRYPITAATMVHLALKFNKSSKN